MTVPFQLQPLPLRPAEVRGEGWIRAIKSFVADFQELEPLQREVVPWDHILSVFSDETQGTQQAPSRWVKVQDCRSQAAATDPTVRSVVWHKIL